MMRCSLFPAVLLAAVLTLTACGGGLPIVSEVGGEQAYRDAQTMIVIATERNRYREVYTDQIWDVPVNADGTTFRAYLLGEIKNFMKELRTMNLLADEKNVRLTGQEQERMRELSDQYYDSLTRADKKYTGAGREDVYGLYSQYCLANKLVNTLTQDVNLEISDSEAKVIGVQEIVLESRETADEVCAKAAEEGTDFLSLARSVSADAEVEKLVGRSERPQAYEDVVFALENGQISPVIESDGKYYIVRVTDDYDEEATQERKEKLSLQRKNQAFKEIYDSFAAEHPVEIRGDIWNTATLEQGENSTTTDFFSLYQEAMNP